MQKFLNCKTPQQTTNCRERLFRIHCSEERVLYKVIKYETVITAQLTGSGFITVISLNFDLHITCADNVLIKYLFYHIHRVNN